MFSIDFGDFATTARNSFGAKLNKGFIWWFADFLNFARHTDECRAEVTKNNIQVITGKALASQFKFIVFGFRYHHLSDVRLAVRTYWWLFRFEEISILAFFV